MITFSALPRLTVICYVLSLLVIGFVMAEQFLDWQLLSKQSKITLLIIAAIIGVAGSIISISKQLARFWKKRK